MFPTSTALLTADLSHDIFAKLAQKLSKFFWKKKKIIIIIIHRERDLELGDGALIERVLVGKWSKVSVSYGH